MLQAKRFVVTLPYTLPVFVAVFTIVAVTFLVCNFFVTEYVWSIGLAMSALLSFWTHKLVIPHVDSSKNASIGTGLVFVACLAWFLGNAGYTSQHVYVNRDPAVYSTAAIWLINHDNLHIKQDYKEFGSKEVGPQGSPGYQPSLENKEEISPQGAQALPALLGLAGRVLGVGGMFHVMPLFGAIGIFAFFGFLRIFVKKQRWSIIGAVILSASLPLIYFSRDTYSEPLALIFVFSSLSMFYFAQKSSQKSLWFLAGVVTGASALARIDSLLSTAGILVAMFLTIAQTDKKQRRSLYTSSAIFLVTTTVIFSLAQLDLAYLSSTYYQEHLPLIKLEVIAIIGLLVGGYLYSMLPKLSDKVGGFIQRNRKRIVVSIAYGIGLIELILLSRPLWYKGMESRSILDVLIIQARQGMPVNGYRNYAENSLEWMMWYIGALTVFLALVGLVLVAIKIFKTRNTTYLAFLGVIGGASAIYLNIPSITADQIWASRRFLPVIIPGLIALAMFALMVAESNKSKISTSVRKHVTPVLMGVAACCLLGAVVTSSPFFEVRIYDGQLSQAEDVCASLPKNAALLLVGDYSYTSVQVLRSLCGDAIVGLAQNNVDISSKQINEVNKAVRKKGRELYVGALRNNAPVLIQNKITTAFSTSISREYERTLTERPEFATSQDMNFYLAKIDGAGHFSPVR